MGRPARLWEWSRLLSEYTIAQLVVQSLGMLAALWLVRLLSVREYALYTLALSVSTFLSVFSDLGVSNALLYFRRETLIARASFTAYVRAAIWLRHRLLILGGGGGLIFIAVAARDHGFAPAEVVAVGGALVAVAWIQVGASLALLQLRLAALYRESYLGEIAGSLARLAAVAVLWIAAAPIAWLAMSTHALGLVATGIVARRGVTRVEASDADSGFVERSRPVMEILRYVLPVSLNAAYFALQAPLVVWLSAYFAGTESVAQVGALGRLGLMFGVLSGFVGSVVIPRLSAVTDDAHYRRRYLHYWTVLGAVGAACILVAYVVPGWLLWLLGDAYRGLTGEVLLIAAGSILAVWGGYAVAINHARGWVRPQSIALVAYVLVQLSLIASLDLSTTAGVLLFGVWSNVAGLALQVAINAAGFLRPRWVGAPRPGRP